MCIVQDIVPFPDSWSLPDHWWSATLGAGTIVLCSYAFPDAELAIRYSCAIITAILSSLTRWRVVIALAAAAARTSQSGVTWHLQWLPQVHCHRESVYQFPRMILVWWESWDSGSPLSHGYKLLFTERIKISHANFQMRSSWTITTLLLFFLTSFACCQFHLLTNTGVCIMFMIWSWLCAPFQRTFIRR